MNRAYVFFAFLVLLGQNIYGQLLPKKKKNEDYKVPCVPWKTYKDDNAAKYFMQEVLPTQDTAKINQFLGKGIDINMYADGNFPMSLALKETALDLWFIEFLLKKGANPNVCVCEDIASANEKPLLAYGSISMTDRIRTSARSSAFGILSQRNHKGLSQNTYEKVMEDFRLDISILQLFEKYGGNISFFMPILFEKALSDNNYPLIKYLIEKGVKVNEMSSITNFLGAKYPFYYFAIDENNIQKIIDEEINIVKLLLEKGASIDAYNENLNKPNPLIAAVANGRPSVVDILLKNGANINRINKACNEYGGCNEISPLKQAIMMNWFEMVKYLISNGANLNLVTDGVTPLKIAQTISKPNKDIIEFLILNGAR